MTAGRGGHAGRVLATQRPVASELMRAVTSRRPAPPPCAKTPQWPVRHEWDRMGNRRVARSAGTVRQRASVAGHPATSPRGARSASSTSGRWWRRWGDVTRSDAHATRGRNSDPRRGAVAPAEGATASAGRRCGSACRGKAAIPAALPNPPFVELGDLRRGDRSAHAPVQHVLRREEVADRDQVAAPRDQAILPVVVVVDDETVAVDEGVGAAHDLHVGRRHAVARP